jgi:hypothetical protein
VRNSRCSIKTQHNKCTNYRIYVCTREQRACGLRMRMRSEQKQTTFAVRRERFRLCKRPSDLYLRLFFASESNLHSLIPSEMLMAGRLFLLLARTKFLRRQIKLVNFHFHRSHARNGFDLHAVPESIKRVKSISLSRRGNYFSRVMCAAHLISD